MQTSQQQKSQFPKSKKIARWQDTKIRALPVAPQDRTLLDEFLDDDWWAKNEPRFLREQGERFAGPRGGRYGRDDTGTTATAIMHHQQEEEKERAEDSDVDVSSYLPGERENLGKWVEALPVEVEIPTAMRVIWEALRSFCSRFPDARFSELSANEQQAIVAMLRTLCEKGDLKNVS